MVVFHGNLGPSMRYERKTVNDVINYSFPASAKLGTCAIIFALITGLYMGITLLSPREMAGQPMYGYFYTGSYCAELCYGYFLYLLFAVKLGWFPGVGFDGPINLVLPTVALGGYATAFIARLSRSSLLEVIRQDYIKVAKAKGLSKLKIIYKHALKNSLIPIITYLGPLIAGVLTGSFVIESLFGIPGLEENLLQSIGNRDYTTTLGVTIFFSIFLSTMQPNSRPTICNNRPKNKT